MLIHLCQCLRYSTICRNNKKYYVTIQKILIIQYQSQGSPTKGHGTKGHWTKGHRQKATRQKATETKGNGTKGHRT